MTTTYLSKPLPKTTEDLIAQRKGTLKQTMNDMVEPLYLKLWDNHEFIRLVSATQDGEAKEGSLSCDDHEAAKMLRDLARIEGMLLIQNMPIASYKSALKVIMRRYEMGRAERRITLGGERVPPLQIGDRHNYNPIAAE